MKVSIADLMEDCSAEDLMIKTEDPKLTARVKKRVLAQIGVEEEKRIPTRSRAGARTRRIFTLALAAALLLSLGLVAYAVSSIHAARQQELRSDLSIDESHIDSYMEYEVPEDGDEGLVLLSAINDGDCQIVFVDVSPVTEEQLAGYPETTHFAWKLNGSLIGGQEYWGTATPRVRTTEILDDLDAFRKRVLEDAYDENTQTLTLSCIIQNSEIRKLKEANGMEEISLTVSLWDSAAQAAEGVGNISEWLNSQPSFGTVTFHPTEPETTSFDINFRYLDEQSGRELEIVSLDLTPVSAVWHVRYEGMEEINSTRDQEELVVWGNAIDRMIRGMTFHFSDGFSWPLTSFGAMAAPYENGTVNPYVSWGWAVNIHDVQRITLGDAILWESSGA